MNNKPTPGSSGDDHEDVEKGDHGLSEPALTGWSFQCSYAQFTAKEHSWVSSCPYPSSRHS